MINTVQVPSSTRRVLSELNANSITAGVKPVPKGTYIHEPVYESFVSARPTPVMEIDAISFGSTKRPAADVVENSSSDTPDGQQEGSNKRVKTAVTPAKFESANLGDSIAQEGPQSTSPIAVYFSSPPLSPASSLVSTVPNDSQNTTLTEIDLEPLSPARRVMSSDEIRQKAKAMKLRLRLASYKIQTNQINIPISQLKIKSSPASARSQNPPHSLRRSSLQTYHRRTPLPDLNLQHPSSAGDIRSQSPESINSSPPQLTSISPRRDTSAIASVPVDRYFPVDPNIENSTWNGPGENVQQSAADSLLTLGRPSFSAEFKRSF